MASDGAAAAEREGWAGAGGVGGVGGGWVQRFREWRVQHPRATFKEIEAALDERWARARASAARDPGSVPAAERPVCPGCGGALVVEGPEERVLTTTYERPIALTRRATACTACRRRVPPG